MTESMDFPIPTWVAPLDLDPECLGLCQGMNAMPGIRTTSSCCGHGRHPFLVFFEPENLDVLPRLLYWFSACHSGRQGWDIKVGTDCGMSPAHFFVEGPIGAFDDADAIGKLLVEDSLVDYEDDDDVDD